MRRLVFFSLAAVVGFAITLHAEEPWFDLEKCGFCQEFVKQPGLLEHMKREYHNTKTGIVSVTYIEKGDESALAKAQAGIGQVVADKMAGKPVVTCRHCAAFGDMYGMGVAPENIKSEKCLITIWASSDPAVVAKLQDFAQKTNEALAEMAKKKDSAPAKH